MVGDGIEARSKFQHIGLRMGLNTHFQGQRDAHPEQKRFHKTAPPLAAHTEDGGHRRYPKPNQPPWPAGAVRPSTPRCPRRSDPERGYSPPGATFPFHDRRGFPLSAANVHQQVVLNNCPFCLHGLRGSPPRRALMLRERLLKPEVASCLAEKAW